MGWTGKVIDRHKGTITLENARPLHLMPAGTSDLIGWTTVVVTAEMVGRRLAVFTAIEAKYKKRKATNEQSNFLEAVRAAGGLGGVARSAADAFAIVDAAALYREGGPGTPGAEATDAATPGAP